MAAQSHNTLPSLHKPSHYSTGLDQQAWEPRGGHHPYSHPTAPTPTLVSQFIPQLGLSRSPGQSSSKAPGSTSSQLLGLSLSCALAERYTAVTHEGSQGDNSC